MNCLRTGKASTSSRGSAHDSSSGIHTLDLHVFTPVQFHKRPGKSVEYRTCGASVGLMTANENKALRAQAVLKLLRDNPEGVASGSNESGVFDKVVAAIPLEDQEQVVLSGGRLRGINNLAWACTEFARAGWLLKIDGAEDIWRISEEGLSALETFTDPEDLTREARAQYSEWSAQSKAKRAELLRTVIVPGSLEEERVREAASLFVVHGLQEGDSVFSPGRSVWNRSAINELLAVFVYAPDFEPGKFVEKLGVQLASASDDARLLMAELVTWQLLPIHKGAIGARAKQQRIETILSYMDHPVQIPAPLLRAFKTGVFNPGQAMANGLFPATVLLIHLVDAWIELSDTEQISMLTDAWKWKEFVFGIRGNVFSSQRNSLLYLVHPEVFPPIVSEAHKPLIRGAFIGEIREPSDDIDRDLLEIILQLQRKSHEPVNFYDPLLSKRWMFEETPVPVPEPKPGPVLDPYLPTRQGFPAAGPNLVADLHMDQTWLQDQLELLERRRQVILYGPPGTGKTFLALALAQHVAGERNNTELVQFHPSYSYEDFFEGYRPTLKDAVLTYEVKPGPLRRIVTQAIDNPEFNYVLVIDEINRGNLAKIFGELYFLLEYRNRRISLQYGDDQFTLPENLFIIGTMNTTDRSIALLDAAMRRRFAFIELSPDAEPTRSVLSRWLVANNMETEPARLLSALNGLLGKSDLRIGPSYFMPSDHKLPEARLASIWKTDILPLLEEHHYGDDTNVARRYGLPAVRAAAVDAVISPAQTSALDDHVVS